MSENSKQEETEKKRLHVMTNSPTTLTGFLNYKLKQDFQINYSLRNWEFLVKPLDCGVEGVVIFPQNLVIDD